MLRFLQRGPYLILAGVSPLQALAASFHAKSMVEMPQISAFTFGSLVQQSLLDPGRQLVCRGSRSLFPCSTTGANATIFGLHFRWTCSRFELDLAFSNSLD